MNIMGQLAIIINLLIAVLLVAVAGLVSLGQPVSFSLRNHLWPLVIRQMR